MRPLYDGEWERTIVAAWRDDGDGDKHLTESPAATSLPVGQTAVELPPDVPETSVRSSSAKEGMLPVSQTAVELPTDVPETRSSLAREGIRMPETDELIR